MLAELRASHCAPKTSSTPEDPERVLGVTMRSLKILKHSSERHGALWRSFGHQACFPPEDAGGLWGVTVRSLKILEEIFSVKVCS